MSTRRFFREQTTPTPACAPPAVANCGVYPNGIPENIYQYESAGIFRQNQFFANVTIRPGTRQNHVQADAEWLLRAELRGQHAEPREWGAGRRGGGGGAGNGGGQGGGGFVTNPYNILGDYGQAGGRFGTRNNVFLLGTISLPHGIAISPTVQVSSGAPYTVTLGKDLLGTSVLNQRPGFVSSATCATTQITGTIYCTPVGMFNSDPTAGEPIVPVNSLTGPAQFTLNLRLTKTFTFGAKAPEGAARGGAGGPGGPREAASVALVAPGADPASLAEAVAAEEGEALATAVASPSASMLAISSIASILRRRSEFLVRRYLASLNRVSNVGAGGSVVANRQIYMQGTFNF